jgi:predicted nucleic acid-binding protein
VKYLIDSNVLLEAALRRKRWQEAAEFLAKTPSADLAIADFSLHAIGFYLIRLTPQIFDQIVADIVGRNVSVLRMEPDQLQMVISNAVKYRLDFDDAFVYTIAELHRLQIVSFDKHFDATQRGRKTPAEIQAGR